MDLDSLKERRIYVNELINDIRKISNKISETLEYGKARPVINSPQDALPMVLYDLGVLDQEELWVMLLTMKHEVMHIDKVYRGTVNESRVRASEVFRSAIIENSPAIIVFHNHPSGDPTPSTDDVAITRKLHEAGKLLDIRVLDHIIVCHGQHKSLKEMQLGFD